WFFVSVKIIMPLLGGKGFSRIIGYRYREVGGSFTGIIKMMLTSPITIIKYMFSPLIKIKYLLSLFLPFCFLPFLNPGLVFICLPVFIQNLLSTYFGQYRLLSQYSALMIPFLFLALINSIKMIPEIIPFKKKLQSRLSIRNTTIQIFFVLIVLITEVLSFKGPDIWPYVYGREDFIATAALPEERIRIVNEIMNIIPARSSVSASHNYLIHHLARRKDIFGIDKNGEIIKDRKPDYVLIDFSAASYFKIEPLEPILNKEYFNIFKNNGLNLFVRKDISSAYDSRKESRITPEEKQMYNRAHNNQAIKSHFIDIRVDPLNPQLYNKLGIYYINQKKYYLAVEQFEKAI
ncbi:MAG: DUF2079 domain-containing protein, partial [Candidatus Omnitrophica bacterium]|nr:DUF2079 domain-containing protein [Candidatus Omnitrophota bacterium]